MRGRYVVCALVLLLAAPALTHIVDCDYNSGYDDCYLKLPYCMQYKVDAYADQEKANFTCLKCDPGYEPIKGGLTDLPLDFRLPDFGKLGKEYLMLCKRTKTPVDGITCSNPLCQSELPHCIRHLFTPINDEIGTYSCIACDENFTLRVLAPLNLSTSPELVKKLCTRKNETRECGEACQAEFPGCKRYSISKNLFVTENENVKELADFQCVEAYPGYEIRNIRVRESTETSVVKDLTIPLYQSPIMNCDDNNCRHVLPNCLKYVYRGLKSSQIVYTCIQCEAAYQPRPVLTPKPSIPVMALNHQFIQVCQIKNATNVPCDDRCKQEFPGCDLLTVWDSGFSLSIDYLDAKLRCEKCAPGFNQLEDESKRIIHQVYPLLDNVKVRCQPEEVATPTDCDEECRKKYPHCLKYTAVFDPTDPPSKENFRCHLCEKDFEPTTDGDIKEWFSSSMRNVCKFKPTNGTMACTGDCSDIFPDCETVSVTHDENGHSTYQCHKCRAGFYPIPYDRKIPGKIANLNSIMKDKPRIYLCAERPSYIYQSIFKCDRKDFELMDHHECQNQPNCKLVVSVRDLDHAREFFRCVLCNQGYRLKSKVPHSYDIDQDQCEPESAALKSLRLA
jgi:hypothetical protein